MMGHPNGVATGTIYHSREALAAANVHVSMDRPVAVIGRKRPQVTSILHNSGQRTAAADGSCMLEFRLPRRLDTLEVQFTVHWLEMAVIYRTTRAGMLCWRSCGRSDTKSCPI